MNSEPECDELLDEVLSEGEGPGFEAELLNGTLSHVRRRRVWRTTLAAGGTLACLAVFMVVVVWAVRPKRIDIPAPVTSYSLVSSHPLAASSIVETRHLEADALVATRANCTVVVGTHDGVHAIGDSELLQLIFPRPAILVKGQSDAEELVFLNPADRNGIRLN